MTIFKASQNKQFFSPFGPTIGYYKMPNNLVDTLNNNMTKDLVDNSDNLVGKVRQELRFDTDTKKLQLMD